MAASPQARQIREIIKEFDGAWVRVWRDGKIWCGLHNSTGWGLGALKDRLEDRGYRVEQNGKPGTEGEFILDVFMPTSTAALAKARGET